MTNRGVSTSCKPSTASCLHAPSVLFIRSNHIKCTLGVRKHNAALGLQLQEVETPRFEYTAEKTAVVTEMGDM